MTHTSRSTATTAKIIQIEKPKSMIAAFLLAFIFGPVGLLYATVAGGLVMIVIALIAMPLTGFLAGFMIWPVCWLWALVAAGMSKSRARKARSELEAASRTEDENKVIDAGELPKSGFRQAGDKD